MTTNEIKTNAEIRDPMNLIETMTPSQIKSANQFIKTISSIKAFGTINHVIINKFKYQKSITIIIANDYVDLLGNKQIKFRSASFGKRGGKVK